MAAKDTTPGELPDDIAKMSYEQAIGALEAIIDKIESGEIGLEDSVKAYERGRLLREHCRRILDKAEQRVSELTPNGTDADEETGASGAV